MSSGKLCVRTRLNGREWLPKGGEKEKWGKSDEVPLVSSVSVPVSIPRCLFLSFSLAEYNFEMEKLSTVVGWLVGCFLFGSPA